MINACRLTNPSKSRHDQVKVKNSDSQFYSVEVSSSSINFLYQFKIWSQPSSPMFVLVKKGSDILNDIKEGDILSMKYYSTDTVRPTRNLNTKILNIKWDDHSRFKGHYVVSLGILQN